MAIWLAVLLLYLFETVPYAVQQSTSSQPEGEGQRCHTARGESGTCINIKQCPPLFELLTTKSKDQSAVQYLRGSQCGFEGRTPKVCCPNSEQPSRTLLSANSNQCGHANPFITSVYNGNRADLGAWPWIAALGYRNHSQAGLVWLCASTLINNRYVVTAAHCIVEMSPWELYVVRVGDLNLDDSVDDGATPQDVDVERTIPHEQYTSDPIANDIALVKLRRAVQFTRLIQPICLPTAAEFKTNSLVNERVFVAVWEQVAFDSPLSDALQDFSIPVVDTERCKQMYASHRRANIDRRNICASYFGGGKITCQGYSGGPLMYLQNSVFCLIGIVSYSYECTDPSHPGVYTKVAEFVDWVSTNVE